MKLTVDRENLEKNIRILRTFHNMIEGPVLGAQTKKISALKANR